VLQSIPICSPTLRASPAVKLLRAVMGVDTTRGRGRWRPWDGRCGLTHGRSLL
jgi:hypothetical protein